MSRKVVTWYVNLGPYSRNTVGIGFSLNLPPEALEAAFESFLVGQSSSFALALG